MFITYHPGYVVDIGAGHRFPMPKYGLVHERLLAEGTLTPEQIVAPQPVATDDLLLVHTRDYVSRFLAGDMTAKEMRTLGFSWSAALARRARLAVHGTITASRLAWRDGLAANLAGGSHHAFADHGEGFSVFNDIAVAIRVLQRDHGLQRAAVVDCDVHQGNGTATIFADDPSVYTCSLHGEKNYPFDKPPSDLDVPLPDGTGDADYLEALDGALETVQREFRPQMVWYLAGVDPYEGDRLGRLSLSLDGLRRRDVRVLSFFHEAGVPVVTTMGGGYAPEIEAIVEAHCQTVRAACRLAAGVSLAGDCIPPPCPSLSLRGGKRLEKEKTMLVFAPSNLLMMAAGLALMVLLSRNGSAEPVSEAIALLEKGKTAERRQAVLTLARIGDQRAAQPLAKAMHDVDRMVRETSAQALWQVWHRSGNAEVDRRLQAGIDAMNRRALEEAVTIFTEVIAMAPDFAEGYNKRATVYYMQERYEASLEDCEKTLELNPIHFGALSGSGLVYMGLRNPVKALELFKRAIAVNPNMPSVEQNIEDITRYLRDQTT